MARGCGWQHHAMYINLAVFYLIGMPIAVALAFFVKLYAKVKLLLHNIEKYRVFILQVNYS